MEELLRISFVSLCLSLGGYVDTALPMSDERSYPLQQ